jgi:hypothetical protein
MSSGIPTVLIVTKAMDQLLRLDQTLQKLFEEVDRRVGLAQTWVVLSADHASMSLVEVAQKRGLPAKRVRSDAVEAAVKQALEKHFPGVSSLIANYDSPNFYLSEETISVKGLKRRAVESVIVKALQETGLFESVYTHTDILSPQNQDDPHLQLIRNSFFEPRSAHIIATPKALYLHSATTWAAPGMERRTTTTGIFRSFFLVLPLNPDPIQSLVGQRTLRQHWLKCLV